MKKFSDYIYIGPSRPVLSMGNVILTTGISFGRNLIGIITRPYETYRRIIRHGTLFELLYIGLLLVIYFAIASCVKTASFRPYLLSRQFIVLTGATAFTFSACTGTLWLAGRILGVRTDYKKIILGWGYTLIPTLVWFWSTSVLYIVLPPPRTTSVPGIVFSIAYLLFSATLFFWKITLAYLTIRFGMRLTLQKITAVVALSLPPVFAWSFAMYRLGIFRIPFL